ncbi:Short-chain dehydrogenase/reductase SDR [Lasiodiplodia theobromae]|uniref:Short chain dehydrogenase sol3 n=1 Tax=Lasiodiplodia theobromae TaxID=45133 RepID=A0A5N5DDX1_9PEZI|nr:Short-chain dehydrogenase/reductase SDR [Lasiodiplodia theobromae]KAB2575640.1 Short chain dehydrogenase sol3 [Lasiodiplodia theobromae]KAF4545548.1 Short-chain dehydrogenase/reductase SDR [Lasiodiplodia theobromae]KAF9636099.1 Short-chain dehydrogenase/reductase SDR [Lasiodiplodia theobromae]
MAIIPGFVYDQYRRLPVVPKDCTGQTIIVTGSNTGIGFDAAKHFVELNAARVIIAVRSLAKGTAAKDAIDAAFPSRAGVAQVWELDLASNASVRAFAKRATDELDRIDVVLENAGVAMAEWIEAEGTETTVQVNVIGTFLLAMLLLPKLKSVAKEFGITPHLTVVSSSTHFDAKFVEGQQDDVFAALAENNPEYMKERYPVSKLIEIYAGRELASLLPVEKTGVVINLLCPGLCWSELTRNCTWGVWLQIFTLRLLLARSQEVGSRTLLHAAVAGPDSHGQVCSDCEIREDKTAEFVKSEEGQRTQKKVWNQLVAKLDAIEPGCVSKALA